MSQRFTLDRTSFEQVLYATSLIQQLKRQAARSVEVEKDFQPLAELVQTQEAIQNESLDFSSATSRVLDLALKLGRATGAAVWLFESPKLTCRGAVGTPSVDDSLQLQVRSRLAARESPDATELPIFSRPDCNVALGASHYPGSVKSLLVAPIHEGKIVAGALSVYSTQFEAFTLADATKARLLSGLLTYAFGRAAQTDLKQSVTVERAAMLQVIDRLMPALIDLAGKQEYGKSTVELLSTISDLQPVVRPGDVPEQLSLPGVESESDFPGLAPSPELRIFEAPEIARGPGVSPAVIESAAPIEEPSIEQPITQQVEVATKRDVDEAPIDHVPLEPPTPSLPLAPRIALPLEHVAAVANAAMQTVSAKFEATAKLVIAQLRAWGTQTSPALSAARKRLLAAVEYQVRIRIPGESKNVRRMLSMSALPAAIFMMIAVSAIMLALGRSPSRTAETMTAGISAPPVVQASATVSKPEIPKPVDTHPAIPASHLQVTDPSLASSLHSLSRFEFAGLQRQALFGDDSAAFLVGMAYETGRYVPQNCAKAAEWVTKSASAGNAAAEYNLGLRYLNGDGVAAGQAAAENWLKKAASRHYARAQSVLKSDR